MSRDFSKPARFGKKPERDNFKTGGFTKPPWPRREHPPGDDRGERGFRKPGDDRGERSYNKPFSDNRGERGFRKPGDDRGERSYNKPFSDNRGERGFRKPGDDRGERSYNKPFSDNRGERGFRKPGDDRGERSYNKPFSDNRGERGFRKPPGDDRGFRKPPGEHREFRPHRDDELFTASGRVADVVGPEPQSRYDMQRKLWDFFRAERLVTPAERRPRANPGEWQSATEVRRPYAKPEYRAAKPLPRKPTGKHPTAEKQRQLDSMPRRKFKETRE